MKQQHKKLERLLLFSEVAQSLSFTIAAEKLGISRGHLSAQIKKLEADMGVPLFVRSTRSVRLTGVGERMMSGMDKIRLAIIELERSAEQEGETIEGMIKITAPALFTHRYLLDITSKFNQRHPEVIFSIDCSYTNHDLNRKDFDLAFRSTEKPPLNMVAKALLSYNHLICASSEYFVMHGKPKTPQELTSHQCIRGQDDNKWSINNDEISINGWLQINNTLMLKQLALSGEGIIRVPSYFVDQEVDAGLLEIIFETPSISKNQIQMIYPQLLQQSKRLQTFIKFTTEYFSYLKL
ncbi:MAG: LysR family transcriptional regulator [Colwellia sp.]|nr:LysR family transcriptional regulator [Colwellia sp.]